MKIDRHDQAEILSSDEISRLFTTGLKTSRDRALFGICLYTGTRIAEACSLQTQDVYNAALRSNSEAWQAELEEREAWNVTLSDGL